jgi:putative colanic acid biosynthesis glycosyltransferase
MEPRPLLTIVTVTFDDVDGLRRTLDSLASIARQAGSNLEVLVVDGGSGPEIHRVAKDFPWAKIRSGRDKGIYDAMNKGLERSRGLFIWFLNGGDECSLGAWEEIAEPLSLSPDSIFFAAYDLRIGSRSIRRLPRSASYIWHGLPTSHQAIFYPGNKARQIRYSDCFSMVGDYHFTAQMLTANIPVVRIELAVAKFYMDGVSFEQAHRVAVEAGVVQSETLKSPLALRYVSRVRHGLSRNVRRLQSKMWR